MSDERLWTPAPWCIEETWSGLKIRGASTGESMRCCEGRPVATLADRFADGRVETFANGVLITAAPDLYEALDRCVERFEAVALADSSGRGPALIAAACAALEKARGTVE